MPTPILLSNIGVRVPAGQASRSRPSKYFCKYLDADPTGTNASYATAKAKALAIELGNRRPTTRTCASHHRRSRRRRAPNAVGTNGAGRRRPARYPTPTRAGQPRTIERRITGRRRSSTRRRRQRGRRRPGRRGRHGLRSSRRKEPQRSDQRTTTIDRALARRSTACRSATRTYERCGMTNRRHVRFFMIGGAVVLGGGVSPCLVYGRDAQSARASGDRHRACRSCRTVGARARSAGF